MKRKYYILLPVGITVILLAVIFCSVFHNGALAIEDYITINTPARIHPDYTSTVIPPNIAPLNFQIKEPGKQFYAEIYSENGKTICVNSRSPVISIPPRRWRKLLEINRGRELNCDIYVKDNNDRWSKFKTITNTIAEDEIDRYLVYRKINLCVAWHDMGTYQRDLSCFNESVVLHNSTYNSGCAHCHSFLNNSPDNMVMQVRSSKYGTPMLMGQSGEITAINTKTSVTPGKSGFTAWHPSGKIIAFSLNKYSMLYHTATVEVREVFDHAADLGLYLLDENRVISTGRITQPDRMETFPAWSPDGKYLYFCSAPQLPPERHKEVLCDLMRIGFDPKTQKWGDLETVLKARKIKRSITQPRFSPDGRYILLSCSAYSDFPIHQAKCDLYLLEVATGQCRKMPISSKHNDSWHGFSGSGRWMVFNSKRMDGRFARPHFSYFDQTGKAHKPFVMPQKNPTYYDSLTRVYNIPELINRPIKISQRRLTESIIDYKKTAAAANAVTGATPGVMAPTMSPQQKQSAWPNADIRE